MDLNLGPADIFPWGGGCPYLHANAHATVPPKSCSAAPPADVLPSLTLFFTPFDHCYKVGLRGNPGSRATLSSSHRYLSCPCNLPIATILDVSISSSQRSICSCCKHSKSETQVPYATIKVLHHWWQSWRVGSGCLNTHKDVMLGSRVSHRGKDLNHSVSQGDRLIRPVSHPVPWVTQCSHMPSGGTDAQAPWCLGTGGWSSCPRASGRHRPAMRPSPAPRANGRQLQPTEVIVRLGCGG